MPSPTTKAGEPRLSEPQADLLRTASRRPQRVVRGYKPAEKLAALGLVEIAITEGAYAWIVQTTTAGLERLARVESPSPVTGGA